MHYEATVQELVGVIRPFKGAMIPYGVVNDLTAGIDKDLYLTLIEGVTVEVIDIDGRRVGIVGGEMEDGGCTRAIPIYPRDLISPDYSFVPREYGEDEIVRGIKQLVDYGRIGVRPQSDGSYVIGIFNCVKLESCPSQVIQKRSGEWDDFFRGAAAGVGNDHRHYSITTPVLPPGSESNCYKAWFGGARIGATFAAGGIVKDKRRTVLLKEGQILGEALVASEVATYAAVIQVFEYLLSRSPGQVIIYGDSKLVIDQLNRKRFTGCESYFSIALEAEELLGRLRDLGWRVDLVRICRKPNEECYELAKRTLVDAGVPLEGRKCPW